jgi:copper homeostasis protein (lipoprotein)
LADSSPLDPLPATFTGTLPCADCPGIHHQLTLYPDEVFALRMTYQSRSTVVDDVGRWVVSSDRSVLMLKGNRDAVVMFRLTSNQTLRLLNIDGDDITSGLNYTLTRSPKAAAFEPTLTMSGMYRYMADAGIFIECATGGRVFVAQEGRNDMLESTYVKTVARPGDEVKAVLQGRLVSRRNPDTGAERPSVVVERVVRVVAGETCAAPPLFALPLEGTRWSATQLGGKAVAAAGTPRGASLVFESGGRVSGSDGCNRVAGSYEVTDNAVKFGRLAGTRMACQDTGDVESAFNTALTNAATWRTTGDRLEFFDSSGRRLARFEALTVR